MHQHARLQDWVRVLGGIDAAELEDALVELRLLDNTWCCRGASSWRQPATLISACLPARAVKEQLQYALGCVAKAGLFDYGRLNFTIAAPAWKHRDYSRLLHALGLVKKFTARRGYESWRDDVAWGPGAAAGLGMWLTDPAAPQQIPRLRITMR